MQKYKVSFKGQNIYVGIDVHLKTWHVTTLTETGCKYSFAQLISGTVLLTQFHFAIYSLYNTIADTCQS